MRAGCATILHDVKVVRAGYATILRLKNRAHSLEIDFIR